MFPCLRCLPLQQWQANHLPALPITCGVPVPSVAAVAGGSCGPNLNASLLGQDHTVVQLQTLARDREQSAHKRCLAKTAVAHDEYFKVTVPAKALREYRLKGHEGSAPVHCTAPSRHAVYQGPNTVVGVSVSAFFCKVLVVQLGSQIFTTGAARTSTSLSVKGV